jgi:5'-phosphate synthase pdxT subunit
MKIGILALQGDFERHQQAIQACGHEAVLVRRAQEVPALDGLIIPGGESTTIGKLIDRAELAEPIKELAARGAPVLGTCAGMILLATEIEGYHQTSLGLIEASVRRNAFGRQIDSFETDIEVEGIEGSPLRAVFIRAPFITSVGPEVKVLAKFEGKIVLARQGNVIACAFHPELTDDRRLHQFLIAIAEKG